MYNYYTQMYEPYRYNKTKHKRIWEHRIICKKIYDGRPDTTTDSADTPPVNSREFEDAGLDYRYTTTNKYYDGLVENQTFVYYEKWRDYR
jgi:hypothetical protein